MNKTLALFTLPLLTLLACGGQEEALIEPAPEAVSEEQAATGAFGDLADPSSLNATAPASFKVEFETTKGEFIVEAHRDWAPLGADRFYNLAKAGFFTDVAFFRVLDGFMAQFGISGDPQLNSVWQLAVLQDDPVTQSNTRGRLSFATGGPNTRTTQMFINYTSSANNTRLDGIGFAPFGEVISGMEVVDSLYKAYGEGAPRGRGPMQQMLQMQGNTYLRESFPELDYIERATLIE